MIALLLQKFLTTGMSPAAFGDLADSQTAAGTTQGTAHETSTAIVRYTTVGASSGALLDNGSKGDSQLIINAGANALTVYPHVGGNIGSLAANVGMSVPAGWAVLLERISTAQWNPVAWALSSGVSPATAPTFTGTTTVEDLVVQDDATVTGDLTVGGTVQVPQLNGGQLAGLRNKIRNGKMQISQRGTSVAIAGTGNNFLLDRWQFHIVGAAAVLFTQEVDGPAAAPEFYNSAKIDLTTADASIAAGDYGVLMTVLEGYDVRDLIGKTFTLSFWVKSPKTGIHCVGFRNSVNDRSYIAEYTVNAADTWEYKTVTVPGGLITAGTWNWTTGVGLNVVWALAAGSTFQGTAGSWQSANVFATASQVNCLDSTANNFLLTGVQLEVGTVATPFEHRPADFEYSLCKRYYQTTRNALGSAVNTTVADFVVPFETEMRTVPSFTVLDSSPDLRVVGATSNIPGTWASISLSPKSAYVQFTRTAGTWTLHDAVGINEAGDVLAFSSEP